MKLPVCKSTTYLVLAASTFVLSSLFLVGLVLMVQGLLGSDHIFIGLACGMIGAALVVIIVVVCWMPMKDPADFAPEMYYLGSYGTLDFTGPHYSTPTSTAAETYDPYAAASKSINYSKNR